MVVKIKGNFRKIIYSSNNFYIVSFKLFPNQNELKSSLEISSKKNSINVILKEYDIDLFLDYEIEIEVVKTNTKYKINYFLKNKEIIILNEENAIIKFLSSSLFPGINIKTANKIVSKIGIDFIQNIDKYEKDLLELIGTKRTNVIFEGILNTSEFNELSKIFIKNNLSLSILDLIKKEIKKEVTSFLKTNVYEIINYNHNIDFIELDKIAKHFSSNYSEDISNEYLILLVILNIENRGSTINEVQKIFNLVNQYKKIEINEFKKYLKNLFDKEQIILQTNKSMISSNLIYKKEQRITNFIKKLSKQKNNYKFDETKLIFEFADEHQQKAILNSLRNSISIITGSPGTGKTLIVNFILKNLKKMNIKNIELLAPTGKSATQLSYSTKKEAKTFHSFLKWNERAFDINENNPSNVEVVIADEFSMIDINLFDSLLKGAPRLKHLIIVGDSNQLPSIGPGMLLNDFINSKKIITTELTKIYRQDEGSIISQNLFLIKDGNYPNFNSKESILVDIDSFNIEDIFIYFKNEENIFDFQILSPMYEGEHGINNINRICQNYLNKNKEVLFTIDNQNFYKDDKVIQIENIVIKNVFNGDLGLIKEVEFDDQKNIKKIYVLFNDNRMIEYLYNEFKKSIKLAYAISVHKFQGSECSKIIFVFSKDHLVMLSRKIFYTAYSRAKKKVIVISTKELIDYSIKNNSDTNRLSNIQNLIQQDDD